MFQIRTSQFAKDPTYFFRILSCFLNTPDVIFNTIYIFERFINGRKIFKSYEFICIE